jgi:glycosyltransferase involved in cell wall biosynthesis
MEARAPRVQHGAAGGTQQHPRDDVLRVAVLAEDVADARAVARADSGEVEILAGMLDDERWVVVDPGAGAERADQVIDLLAGRGREPEPLVEGPDALDDRPPEEDRERDRAIPEVVARQGHGRSRPPRLSSDDAVDVLDARGNTCEQVGRIDAVVVRERDDVSRELGEGDIARSGEACRGAQADDALAEQGHDPVVVVLVDDEHTEVTVRLRVERREEPLQLGRASDGRDDKVESHGRTLTPVPLVSVLLAVHDDTRFLREAVDSVLGQTLSDLELILVDDASAEPVRGVDDARVRLLRNETQLGLAASLNRALEAASGKYVARLDADDVALPRRLEQQVESLRGLTAVVGSAVVDVDEHGARGRIHVMPESATELRWHALFSSPFFHPTVLVDREALEARGLRYDPEFLESEDYDLWTRLFEHADGANLREPLVLKRVHAGQASQRRRELQESFQRRVALREIGRYGVDSEAVWGGSRRELVRLLRAFERQHGANWRVRRAALRRLVA